MKDHVFALTSLESKKVPMVIGLDGESVLPFYYFINWHTFIVINYERLILRWCGWSFRLRIRRWYFCAWLLWGFFAWRDVCYRWILSEKTGLYYQQLRRHFLYNRCTVLKPKIGSTHFLDWTTKKFRTLLGCCWDIFDGFWISGQLPLKLPLKIFYEKKNNCLKSTDLKFQAGTLGSHLFIRVHLEAWNRKKNRLQPILGKKRRNC